MQPESTEPPYDDGITCAQCGGQAGFVLGEEVLCLACVAERTKEAA